MSIESEITKTCQNLLIRKCVQCIRKKPIIFGDNTIPMEQLDNFGDEHRKIFC